MTERGGRHLTRKERRQQAREARKHTEVTQIQRVGRRRAFKWIGGAVLAAAGLAAASQTPQGRSVIEAITQSSQPKGEFSGGVEETKQTIQQLQKEINEGKRTFEGELKRIVDLTASYYSSEMQQMFPARREQYNRQAIKGKVMLLTQDEYLKSAAECKEIKSDTAERNPLVTISLKGIIHVNKDYYARRKNVGLMVHDLIHEFHHLTAVLKEKPRGTRVLGIPEEITHEKGLGALSRVKPDSDNCVNVNRASMEEPVVEDSTLRMSEKIDIKLAPDEMAYARSVSAYRSVLVNPPVAAGGFGGDHRELLNYQQITEPDLFFGSIGKRRFPQVASRDEQIRLGTFFAIQNFSTNIYGN